MRYNDRLSAQFKNCFLNGPRWIRSHSAIDLTDGIAVLLGDNRLRHQECWLLFAFGIRCGGALSFGDDAVFDHEPEDQAREDTP